MPQREDSSRIPSPSAVERLAEFLRKRTHLQIRARSFDIITRLIEKRCELKRLSPEDYVDRIITTNDSTEADLFTVELTVGETHFFRGPPQFDALRNEIVPAIHAKKKRTRAIYALSAGCSTGEEPYSMAIVLREVPTSEPWRIEVTGIDINTRSIQKAENAVFSAWSLRDMPDADRRRYFRIEGDSFRLNEDIRRHVRFRRAALTDAALDTLFPLGIDLAVCQNVLYYLDEQARAEVVLALAQSLAIGGYLLLGPVDHFGDVPGCQPRQMGEIVVYERTGPVVARAPISSAVLRRSRWPAPETHPLVPPIGPVRIPTTAPLPKDLAPVVPISGFDIRDFEVPSVPHAPTPTPTLDDAFAKANTGDLQGALDLLNPLLDEEPEEPKGHLLEGLILTDLGSFDAALDAFRRCVYLDPSMMLAHAGAAVACMRLGRMDLVERHSARLRALGRDKNPDEPVDGWEGMTVGRLLRMFQETNIPAPRALEVLGR
jgi:chemotaxis protein methyltransferase CheR